LESGGSWFCHAFIHVVPTEVEQSLTISVFENAVSKEISRDVSRSTRCPRSGQALNMTAAPLLNGMQRQVAARHDTRGVVAAAVSGGGIISKSADEDIGSYNAMDKSSRVPIR
jgi:hypothetical protein